MISKAQQKCLPLAVVPEAQCSQARQEMQVMPNSTWAI